MIWNKSTIKEYRASCICRGWACPCPTCESHLRKQHHKIKQVNNTISVAFAFGQGQAQPLHFNKFLNLSYTTTKHSFFFIFFFTFLLFGCDNQEVALFVPSQKIAKKEQIISKSYALEEGKMTLFFTDTNTKAYNPQNELLNENNQLFYDLDTLKMNNFRRIKNIYITQKNDTNVQKNYVYSYQKDKIEIKRKINGEDKVCIEIIEDIKQNIIQQTYFDENNLNEKITEILYIYKNDILKEKRQLLYENNSIKTRTSTFFEYNKYGSISKKVRFNAKDTTNMSKKRFIYEKLDTINIQQKHYIYNEKKQLYKLKISKIMTQNADIEDFVSIEKTFDYDTQGRCKQVRTCSVKIYQLLYTRDTTMQSITTYEYLF